MTEHDRFLQKLFVVLYQVPFLRVPFLFLVALVVALSSPAWAANKDKEKEIIDEDTTIITSDGGLNLDYAKHVAIFKKNVVVRDHRGTLKAQEMHVQFEAESSKIRTIEAMGDVQVVQEGRIAESQNALIKSEQGVIILTGDPKIKQGRDIYSGDKITIFSKTNQVIFEPKAKLMIFQQPGQKKELF